MPVTVTRVHSSSSATGAAGVSTSRQRDGGRAVVRVEALVASDLRLVAVVLPPAEVVAGDRDQRGEEEGAQPARSEEPPEHVVTVPVVHWTPMAALPAPRLLDQFGRVGRDLRVSVTDRCNLRCTYCMPAEGLDWLPKPEMLTDDELVRLVEVMVGLGVTTVRLTGGEPLLRRSLVDVVRRIAALEPRPRIAMTTNGIGLDRLAAPLAAAGLDRVNVSLDTIDSRQFTDLTRRDRLQDVVAGLKAAADAGLAPVKVNAVAMRGINDGDVAELLAVVPRPRLPAALHRADAARRPARLGPCADGVPGRDPRAARASASGSPRSQERGSAPAELFLVDGGPQTVGVIASVTAPFCGACDRARLTADGQLRNCLFARQRGRPAGSDAGGRVRRRARRPRHRRDVGQEGRARHRPARLRAAGAPDVSDRWLTAAPRARRAR